MRITTVLKLIIAPRSLAVVAAGCTTLQAYSVSAVVLLLESGLFWSAGGAGISEPYLDLQQYYGAILAGLPLATCVFGSVSTLMFLAILHFWAFAGSRFLSPIAYRRLVVLIPVTTAVPYFLWVLLGCLHSVQGPTFDLMSGKPAWLMSPIITIAGSGWWLLVITVLATANGIVSIRKLRELLIREKSLVCVRCGYNLTGLMDLRCPECFTSFATPDSTQPVAKA